MFDYPREDTAQTIVEAPHVGVPVKILTVDGIAITKWTCKMVSEEALELRHIASVLFL